MKLLFGFLIFFSSFAEASFLQMIGSSQLQLRETEKGLSLKGTYVIQNRGDELAKNVHPKLSLDNFSVVLEKRMILAGESFEWKIDIQILNSQLCLEVSPRCPVALGKKGDITLRVDKMYQDANSYQFSAPEVLLLSTDAAVKGPVVSTGYGMLIVTTEALGKGIFKVQYDLKNMTDENIEAEIQAILPEQMVLETLLPVLKIGPKAGLLTHFQFRNEKALDGSVYQIPVVARWKDSEGSRRSIVQIGGVRVQNNLPAASDSVRGALIQKLYLFLESLKRDSVFWWVWSGIFAVGFLGMYFFWMRPYQQVSKN